MSVKGKMVKIQTLIHYNKSFQLPSYDTPLPTLLVLSIVTSCFKLIACTYMVREKIK